MTNWIFLAGLAYCILAFSQLIDKALLNVAFQDAKSYAFLISCLGLLVLILLPFGITLPSTGLLIGALAAGAIFILALLPFLSALQGDDASRIIPLVGAIVPLFSLAGEVVFLHKSLEPRSLVAFFLLVTGAVVLTMSRSESPRRSWLAVGKACLGAVLFSASFVASKYLFDRMGFLNAFFYMRLGGAIVGIALLGFHDVRTGVVTFFKKNKLSIKVGYFANQGLNGAGFVLQNIAISLGSVSLVNAMQGVQYFFVILFIFIASRFRPALLGEKITKRILLEKLTAVFILIAGLALLAL